MQRDPENRETKVLHNLIDLTNQRVLEIGCGEGRLTWKYAAKAKKVLAFDVDHKALQIARADCPSALHGHIHFWNGAANQIPCASQSIDVAILSWSL